MTLFVLDTDILSLFQVPSPDTAAAGWRTHPLRSSFLCVVLFLAAARLIDAPVLTCGKTAKSYDQMRRQSALVPVPETTHCTGL